MSALRLANATESSSNCLSLICQNWNLAHHLVVKARVENHEVPALAKVG